MTDEGDLKYTVNGQEVRRKVQLRLRVKEQERQRVQDEERGRSIQEYYIIHLTARKAQDNQDGYVAKRQTTDWYRG